MFSWWRKAMESETPIPNITDLDVPFQTEVAVLFKHSPKCPLSLAAYREVAQFRREFPAIPVFLISVREERPLAVEISRRTGVTHASPQILVLQKGAVRSVISHEQITADEIADLVGLQAQAQAHG